jgi:hypothetical protein
MKDYQTKDKIAHFNSSGELYSLHGAPIAAPPTSLVASVDLWHQCLGHPHTATLSTLLSDFSIPSNRDSHNSSVYESSSKENMLGYLMTHKYRGSQHSSREVKPKFIDSTQEEPKNIYKP